MLLAAVLASALVLSQALWNVGPYLVIIMDGESVERACIRLGARPTPGKRIVGCYAAELKTIYTINDASVLAHEFKHALEPEWHHE